MTESMNPLARRFAAEQEAREAPPQAIINAAVDAERARKDARNEKQRAKRNSPEAKAREALASRTSYWKAQWLAADLDSPRRREARERYLDLTYEQATGTEP